MHLVTRIGSFGRANPVSRTRRIVATSLLLTVAFATLSYAATHARRSAAPPQTASAPVPTRSEAIDAMHLAVPDDGTEIVGLIEPSLAR